MVTVARKEVSPCQAAGGWLVYMHCCSQYSKGLNCATAPFRDAAEPQIVQNAETLKLTIITRETPYSCAVTVDIQFNISFLPSLLMNGRK